MPLIEELISLFEINKQRKKWDNWLDDEATWRFINAVGSDPSFINTIDSELAAEFLPILFNDFEFPSKESLEASEANSFLQLLSKNMLSNMSDYWIVLPLLNAEATQSIKISDDISILAGNREEKFGELTQIIGLEMHEAESRFVHTEKSRSPDFFKDPLLVIKINHQHRIVHENAVAIAYYAVNFINVLYWGYVPPTHKIKSFKLLLNGKREHVNQHIMIQSVNGSNWGHRPLNFEYNCHFNLDWLNDKVHGKRLLDLMSLISFVYEQNGLTDRFLRGIRFFVRGINVKSGNRFFDAESDAILLMNIASECVLIKSQEERNKSRKIKGRLSKLGNIEEVDIESRKRIIERMSNLRGSYVHEGLYNNVNSFLDGEEKLSELEAYKKIVARFLCGAFELTEKCRAQAAIDGKDVEETWFESFQD
ncbi:HEPN domain-containing protein [Paenibacillus sp. MBLB2552]|uniref:HEPN domain-containing protein n=1 Tax=Paenibacillus mellifer TaxID=2937794 RepID=A0A9X1Y296_9BACL|nr:HEPN domain-containing protein [Paenibacillus mellifer]MCK8489253.1 HEPN domain-containing protein [Paenibacillus mellifer]